MISFSRVAEAEADQERRAQLLRRDLQKCWKTIDIKVMRNPSGWVYRDKVTYVDLGIYNVLDYILDNFADFPRMFPHVMRLRAKVAALPNIARWLQNRP